MKRTLATLAAMWIAAGCATIERGIDRGTEAISYAVLPTSAEIQLGSQLAADIERQEDAVDDREVQKYVDRIGQRLVKAAGDDVAKGMKFHFTVIDRPNEVNAFAIPGGHVYVFSGLMKAAASEAELASVLAHEIAHVTSRHGADTLVKAMGLQAIAGLALGQDPNALAAIAANLAGGGYLAHNSRANESQADARGLAYLIRAGYDPDAFPAFFSKLARLQGKTNAVAGFFATHPDPGERAKIARRHLKARNLHEGKQEVVGGFDQAIASLGGPSRIAGKSGSTRDAPGRKVAREEQKPEAKPRTDRPPPPIRR